MINFQHKNEIKQTYFSTFFYVQQFYIVLSQFWKPLLILIIKSIFSFSYQKTEMGEYSKQAQRIYHFTCQICEDNKKNMVFCNCCLLVCCAECKSYHQCSNLEISGENSLQQSKSRLNSKRNTRNTRNFYQTTETFLQEKKKKWDKIEIKKSSLISCERCIINRAEIQCFKCKIKYLCSTCFRDVHSSWKVSTHQHQIIQRKDHQINRIGSYSSLVQQDLQAEVKKVPQKPEVSPFSSLYASIDLIKSQLILQKNTHQLKVSQLVKRYQRELQLLIEQIRQKLSEITAIARQHSQEYQSFYQDIDKQLVKEERGLLNLTLLHNHKNCLNISSQFIDSKRIQHQQSINKLIVKISDKKISDISLNQKWNLSTEELKQVQQMIRKVQSKAKIFANSNPTKSKELSLNNSQRESKAERNSKRGKNSLSHFANQSKSKPILPIGNFISPKKSQRYSVIIKGQVLNTIGKNISNRKGSKCGQLAQIGNTMHFNDYFHQYGKDNSRKKQKMIQSLSQSPKISRDSKWSKTGFEEYLTLQRPN